MKISIRRHGIVIKTIPVAGETAAIGSSADCEIQLDDPYLAPHVADLALRNGEWRIVDTGTALEGVSRGGSRAEDEPLVEGETYSIGAFELIAEQVGGTKPSVPPPPPPPPPPSQGDPSAQPSSAEDPNLVPRTMMQGASEESDGENVVPKTMWAGNEDAAPKTQYAASLENVAGSEPRREQQPHSLKGFKPVTAPGQPAAPPPRPAAEPARPPKKKRLLLIVATMGLLLVLLMVILVMTGRDSEPPVVTDTAPPAVEEPPPPELTASELAEQGDAHLRRLRIDQAMASWKEALEKGADESVRERLVLTAWEIAMVHDAARQSQQARPYLETVVQYGDENSPQVAAARAKLGG